VYNLALDEFIARFGLESRPGFTKATVNAWRGSLEARGLGSVSVNVRITAVRKRRRGCRQRAAGPGTSRGHRAREGREIEGSPARELAVAGQAQALLSAPDTTTKKALRDRAMP
jgi:hypothetical protein